MSKIHEIATRLGLSVSTVYKAFNGASDIKPETRLSVQEMAVQIGYVPKVREKGHRVLIFAKRMEEDFITHYLYEIMLAFKQCATNNGYEILIIPVDRTDIRYFASMMQELHAQGCMILVLNDEDYSQMKDFTYPTVLVDNIINQKNVACATSDKLTGVELQIRHLAKLGHRKIGYINSSQGVGRKERLAGYINALTVLGIPYDPELVKYGDFSEKSGEVFAAELVKQGVTAIACANDLMAIGAIRKLNEMKLRIPEDISIIGFDDIKLARYIVPGLTSVHISTKNMGMQAFLCLKNLLENQVSTRIVESPKLVVRGTTTKVCNEDSLSVERC